MATILTNLILSFFFTSESVTSTGSNFSIIESQSRRLHRLNALSPGTSLSRSSSRKILSPNSFSRSLSRASLNRSFTRRQLMQMQESKRRFTKEEVKKLLNVADQ